MDDKVRIRKPVATIIAKVVHPSETNSAMSQIIVPTNCHIGSRRDFIRDTHSLHCPAARLRSITTIRDHNTHLTSYSLAPAHTRPTLQSQTGVLLAATTGTLKHTCQWQVACNRRHYMLECCFRLCSALLGGPRVCGNSTRSNRI